MTLTVYWTPKRNTARRGYFRSCRPLMQKLRQRTLHRKRPTILYSDYRPHQNPFPSWDLSKTWLFLSDKSVTVSCEGLTKMERLETIISLALREDALWVNEWIASLCGRYEARSQKQSIMNYQRPQLELSNLQFSQASKQQRSDLDRDIQTEMHFFQTKVEKEFPMARCHRSVIY